jgi:hypothetical protein
MSSEDMMGASETQVAVCVYCQGSIRERDLVLTKRGPMHEDCADDAAQAEGRR